MYKLYVQLISRAPWVVIYFLSLYAMFMWFHIIHSDFFTKFNWRAQGSFFEAFKFIIDKQSIHKSLLKCSESIRNISKGKVFPSLNTNTKKWFTKNHYCWVIFIGIQKHNSFSVVYRDIFVAYWPQNYVTAAHEGKIRTMEFISLKILSQPIANSF